MRELILDKIQDNIKEQKKLITLAKKIKNLREEQDEINDKYNDIVSKMASKLTTERIMTKIKIDIKSKTNMYDKDDFLGINKSGFGYLSTYRTNLTNLDIETVKQLLKKNYNKIIPYFKNNKKALDILKIFENILPNNMPIFEIIKCDFLINTNTIYVKRKLCKINFDTENPFQLNSNYSDSLELDNIESYIAIEEQYDNLKSKYEETINLMTLNNKNLELELTNLQNAFAHLLILEVL